MRTILIPVAGERQAARAAEQAIALYRREPAEIHLLNVQHPLPRHVSQFFPRSEVHAFLHDAGMAALAPAIRALDAAAIPHVDHVVVGHAAQAIVQFAESHRCDDIVLDERASGVWSLLRAGSVGSQVRHLQQSRATASAVPRNA
jgi:nucleotide-binding universal stress UspA family protein